MLIGYAALQPGATGAEAEPHGALIAAGVSRLFIDVILNDMPRTQLDAAIDAAGTGDVLVSTTIDCLARVPQDLFGIVRRLEAKGASLRVLCVSNLMPLDTATPEGRAMLGALAILQAMTPATPVRDATASSAAGETTVRPRGRPATAFSQSDEVARLHANGLRATDIADRLGIGRASVYRILSQSGAALQAPGGDGRDTGRAAQLARRLQETCSW